MTFVLDASVALAWILDDESAAAATAARTRLDEGPAVVPAIWSFEVSNALLVAERRGRTTQAHTHRALALLEQLPIEVASTPTSRGELVAAGRGLSLSAFDASYVVLAERLGTPLATLDARLAEAASRAGVPLLIA